MMTNNCKAPYTGYMNCYVNSFRYRGESKKFIFFVVKHVLCLSIKREYEPEFSATSELGLY